ncbi:DUF2652 domain-containing protein [Dokdonella sp.]|uniref:DUF2652 domain-containing protein n=1 Tax=Dokdonella sp. TaxID=2291710 RepID=UPI003C62E4BC
MRICQAFLVVIDISGYTRFITRRTLSLQHAEQIISDLIGVVVDESRHPLILNKLEGDAALMYAEIEADSAQSRADLMAQVRSFFPAFRQRVLELSKMRDNCSCDACTNITALGLKAFVHCGEILLKQFRQFEELAGEPVILLHRLMKNSVQGSEYVLMSDAAMRFSGLDDSRLQSHVEHIEGMGTHQLWVASAYNLPEWVGPESASAAIGVEPVQTRVFRNLPADDGATLPEGWVSRLWRRLRR